MSELTYVAMGDGLTTGRGDPDPDGRPIGFARRLCKLLAERAGVSYALTDLSRDGATAANVLEEQLPAARSSRPDLVTLAAGVNDIRAGFDITSFMGSLDEVFAGLTETGAVVVTMTLPDLAAVLPLSDEMRDAARELLRQANEAIVGAAGHHGVLYLDAWSRPEIADEAFWTDDQRYPSAYGHQVMARGFLDLLLSSGALNPDRLRAHET